MKRTLRIIQTKTEASAFEIITVEQAFRTIEPGDGAISISREGIEQRLKYQERKRQHNISSVINKAAEDLDRKEVVDHEPDADWTTRFFNCIQDVSSEDLQRLWSKVLAGEIEKPGGTSLRTLDALRNLTAEEANLFRNICSFVFDGSRVFYQDSFVGEIADLAYGRLLRLQNCGLVNAGPSLTARVPFRLEFETGETGAVLRYQDGLLVIVGKKDRDSQIKIPEVLLTSAGQELFGIIDCPPSRVYLKAFARFLQEKQCRLYVVENTDGICEGKLRISLSSLVEP